MSIEEIKNSGYWAARCERAEKVIKLLLAKQRTASEMVVAVTEWLETAELAEPKPDSAEIMQRFD